MATWNIFDVSKDNYRNICKNRWVQRELFRSFTWKKTTSSIIGLIVNYDTCWESETGIYTSYTSLHSREYLTSLRRCRWRRQRYRDFAYRGRIESFTNCSISETHWSRIPCVRWPPLSIVDATEDQISTTRGEIKEIQSNTKEQTRVQANMLWTL